MSLRQGLELISGAGSSPYINKTTGNWEICGIDTGVPATHIKITVNEYNEVIRTGNYDNSKMYFITDATPKVFINKQILSSNWTQVGSNRYTNTISIPNVSSTDIIMVDIASGVSDDTYIEHKSLIDDARIQRIRSEDGKIVIVSSSPINTDILVDVTVTKCILEQ